MAVLHKHHTNAVALTVHKSFYLYKDELDSSHSEKMNSEVKITARTNIL